jgi:predicted RNA methylase
MNDNTITKARFLQHVRRELDAGAKHNKKSIERIASFYGITDKTEIKEFTELAIVLKARSIALSSLSIEEKYWKIVELYQSQVNLSHRTSQSILLQQYSTPAPISFLAGIFTNADQNISVFEPSAGNGLLTITANPSRVVVNELDILRRTNLIEQGYKQVLNQDATQPFRGFEKKFDAVLTNPPFGLLEKEVKYETFSIEVLDHLMALRALDCMKDNGKAAIIIGGHTRYDKKGRIQKGKNRFFFNYLFSRYNVLDIIPIDGHKLYSRQGTSFDTRLILIDGRKSKPSGAAPLKNDERDKVVDSFDELFERVMSVTQPRNEISMNPLELEAQALALELELMSPDSYRDELGMPYTPASSSCVVLDTVVPDSMGFETHAALQRIKEAVGGDIDEYVRIKLNYRSNVELCKALSAEQIDAVAMSIYNIEERGVGMIIGDQTGIGKGRIAASVIRYAVEQGVQPIFITEKANLFSDIYRDLVAIGSAHLVPFIVNSRESKTDIKNEDGEVVYQALPAADQNRIFESQRVPKNFHFVVATYSQFNSPEKKPTKPAFLNAIAEDNIVIMDEAHNSSGSGNTGNFMQSALARSRGVVFLSATFAKRPDNMPIYAMKTSIRDASMTRDALIEAITKGGVALQEILASQLVAEGQMIRRERSFEGVEVNYVTLEDKEQEHKAIADNITSIVRDIIKFQTTYVDEIIEELDDIAVAEGKQVEIREGTSQAGVDNLPYFSKVFNVINQMLFSIKAEAVAERAITRLKEGKKPVIAFASTMGSFIEQMESDTGLAVTDGDTINADFSVVLQKGLDGILRYTETDTDGQKIFKKFEISEFPLEAQAEYHRISDRIKEAATGITISPIDVIVRKITEAGYKVAEVTGRKYELQINAKTNKALVLTRKRVNTNDAFRQFNNNEVDVLLINQSGSTGASAHAIVTPKVFER